MFPFIYDANAEPVNATFEGATIAGLCVHTAFDAANRHRANGVARCRRPVECRQQPNTASSRWRGMETFRLRPIRSRGSIPAGDRGFELDDAEALLQLQVDEVKELHESDLAPAP